MHGASTSRAQAALLAPGEGIVPRRAALSQHSAEARTLRLVNGTAPRPFWQWALLGIAPGLVSDLLSWLEALSAARWRMTGLSNLLVFATLFAPLFGLAYLIMLGRRYAAQGEDRSALLFVFGFGAIDLLLWGAGCSLTWSHISVH
jgi:hypothetical protein